MEAPRSEAEKGAAHLIIQEDAVGHPRVVPFRMNDLDLSSLALLIQYRRWTEKSI